MSGAAALPRPRLRGRLHQWAFAVSLVLGAALLPFAHRPRALAALALYAASVSALFGVSALYHRRTWTPAARRWMRRLDHSLIFLLIPGTYTPFAVVALRGTPAGLLLAVVWVGAVLGVLVTLLWIEAPKWLVAALCLALGWAVAAAMPAVGRAAGPAAVGLIVAGGVLYSAGAVVYALGRPDPAPAVFGFHELFHVFTIAGALAHYVAVAVFVVPRA